MLAAWIDYTATAAEVRDPLAGDVAAAKPAGRARSGLRALLAL